MNKSKQTCRTFMIPPYTMKQSELAGRASRREQSAGSGRGARGAIKVCHLCIPSLNLKRKTRCKAQSAIRCAVRWLCIH